MADSCSLFAAAAYGVAHAWSLYRPIICNGMQCVIQAFARGGAPRVKRWAPRGNLTKKVLLRRWPAKPPGAERWPPRGNFSRGPNAENHSARSVGGGWRVGEELSGRV
jgi:hypothetical protein